MLFFCSPRSTFSSSSIRNLNYVSSSISCSDVSCSGRNVDNLENMEKNMENLERKKTVKALKNLEKLWPAWPSHPHPGPLWQPPTSPYHTKQSSRMDSGRGIWANLLSVRNTSAPQLVQQSPLYVMITIYLDCDMSKNRVVWSHLSLRHEAYIGVGPSVSRPGHWLIAQLNWFVFLMFMCCVTQLVWQQTSSKDNLQPAH